MQSKLMELAVFWLPIIGAGIFIAFAGNAWYSNHKSQALWLGFCGVFCLLLLGAIQVQKFIWDAQAEEKPEAISLADRPWVAISNVRPISDLTYTDKGWDAGFRWNVSLSYDLRNTGKTPAIGVEVVVDFLPFLVSGWPAERVIDGKPQGQPDPGTDVNAELRRRCESHLGMRQHFPPLVATNLYPGDQPIRGVFTLNGNPALFDAAKANPLYSGNLVVFVCATYKFATGAEFHQTGTAFALFKDNDRIDLRAVAVPLGELRVVPQPMTTGVTS